MPPRCSNLDGRRRSCSACSRPKLAAHPHVKSFPPNGRALCIGGRREPATHDGAVMAACYRLLAAATESPHGIAPKVYTHVFVLPVPGIDGFARNEVRERCEEEFRRTRACSANRGSMIAPASLSTARPNHRMPSGAMCAATTTWRSCFPTAASWSAGATTLGVGQSTGSVRTRVSCIPYPSARPHIGELATTRMQYGRPFDIRTRAVRRAGGTACLSVMTHEVDMGATVADPRSFSFAPSERGAGRSPRCRLRL